jgi:hypothetical protein
MLTEQHIAAQARILLGHPDASRQLALTTLIPYAIERLATKSVEDEQLKHLFLLSGVTGTLDGSGRLDLTTVLTNNKVLQKFIDRGQIYHASSTKPMQFIQNPEMADLGVCEDDVLLCWLRGKILYTRNFTPNVGTPLSGTITLELPYVPALSAFPIEMQMDLVSKVVELASGVRNDAGEDGPG